MNLMSLSVIWILLLVKAGEPGARSTTEMASVDPCVSGVICVCVCVCGVCVCVCVCVYVHLGEPRMEVNAI